MAHPFGERALVETPTAAMPAVSVSDTPILLDSYDGRVHVHWAPDEAVTPLGQLPFFIDYLRVHLRINEPCEPSCHDLDHGDLDETRCALGVSFEIPGHAPVCGDPGQRTLDDPALGQDHETLCCV